MPPNNGKAFVKTLRNDTYPAIDPKQWDMRGRTVAITGASKGVGRATAISYAQAGASGIALIARSPTDLEESAKLVRESALKCGRPEPQILQLVADTTDEASVLSAASQVAAAFHKLDILVNNAGVLSGWNRIGEADTNDWWSNFVVNVKGSYLVTSAFLPTLIKEPNGLKTIVNVASFGAHLISHGGSGYQITKLALLRFTEFLQAEYQKEGILSIAIHPGGIPTDLAHNMASELLVLLTDTLQLAGDSTVWLTKERREWLNGRYIDCCWDVAELEAKRDEIVLGDKLKVSLVV